MFSKDDKIISYFHISKLSRVGLGLTFSDGLNMNKFGFLSHGYVWNDLGGSNFDLKLKHRGCLGNPEFIRVTSFDLQRPEKAHFLGDKAQSLKIQQNGQFFKLLYKV